MDEQQHASIGVGPLIVLPWLNQASLPVPAPAGALFFDPGAEENKPDARGRTWRPTFLPLPPKQARRILAAITQFGEQFRDPQELASFAAGAGETGYCNAGAALRSELAALARLGAGEPEPVEAAPMMPYLLQAQQLLLLASSMEGRLGEIVELQASVERSTERFNASLGLTDEAEDIAPQPVDAVVGGGAEALMPWPLILESMMVLLPDGACFFVADPSLRSEWEENGIQASPITEEELRVLDPNAGDGTAAENYCVYVAPAWRLLGKRTLPADKPWLKRDVRMYCATR